MISIKHYNQFYIENKDKLHPTTSYSLNDKNFQLWIDRQGDDNSIYKAYANILRKYTKHISFKEFNNQLGSVASNINNIINIYKPINVVLIVDINNYNKSSFWISLLLYEKINHDKITHIITNPIDTRNFQGKTLCIHPEDASYSGIQLSSLLGVLNTETRNTDEFLYYIACPFISKKAYDKIKKISKVIYIDKQSTIFFDSLGNNKKHEPPTIKNFVKKISKYDNLHTIYFDHKLADNVSIPQEVYVYGRNLNEDEDDEIVTLIENCNYEKYKNIIKKHKDMYDIQELISTNEMCPPAFYKHINYTFNNKPFKGTL